MSKRDNAQLSLFLQYGFTQPIAPKTVGRTPIPFVVGTTESGSGVGIDVGANGDDLVAFVITDNVAVTQPTGWTLVPNSSTVWNGSLKYTAWSIRRGASAPALTWSAVSGGITVVIRAIRPPNGYTASYNSAVNAVNATTAPVSPTITTATSNALILIDLALLSSATVTLPASFTTDLNDGTGFGLAAGNTLKTFAGASGNYTWGLSISDNTVSATIAVEYAASASTNFTGTLTGQAVVAASGALAYAFDKALTGQAVTAASGTVVYALSKNLVGQAVAASTGTLTYAFDKALAGQPVASSTGAIVYAFDKSLTGQGVTSATGTVVFDPNMSFTGTLTGQSVSAATGSLTYAFDKGLTGQAVTTATGSIVYAFSTTIAGQAASAATGNISYTFSKSLAGQPSTANTGTLIYVFDKGLTGQPATGSTGTVTFSSSVDFTGSLTGQGVTGATGLLGYTFSKSLTGQAANNAQGILTYSFDKSLVGQPVTASTGAVTFTSASIDFTGTLTGQQVTSSQGVISFDNQSQQSGNEYQGLYPKERKPKSKPQYQEKLDSELSLVDAEIKELLLVAQQKSVKTAKSRKAAKLFELPQLEVPKTELELPITIVNNIIVQDIAISDDDIEMMLALMIEMI